MRLAVEEQDVFGELPFPFLQRVEPTNGTGEWDGGEHNGRIGVCERLDACHTCFVEGERQSRFHLAFIEQPEDLVWVRFRIPKIATVNRDEALCVLAGSRKVL